jgi:hypothetical protein
MGHEVDFPLKMVHVFLFIGLSHQSSSLGKKITPFAPNNINFNAKSPSNSPPKVVRKSTNIEVNLLDPPPLMLP